MKKYYPEYKGTRQQMMTYLAQEARLSEREGESGRPRMQKYNEVSIPQPKQKVCTEFQGTLAEFFERAMEDSKIREKEINLELGHQNKEPKFLVVQPGHIQTLEK